MTDTVRPLVISAPEPRTLDLIFTPEPASGCMLTTTFSRSGRTRSQASIPPFWPRSATSSASRRSIMPRWRR